jgi:hypothetical protein
MTADEKLAERISKARWEYYTWISSPHPYPSWRELSRDARDTLLCESRQIMSAFERAGLEIVEKEDKQ